MPRSLVTSHRRCLPQPFPPPDDPAHLVSGVSHGPRSRQRDALPGECRQRDRANGDRPSSLPHDLANDPGKLTMGKVRIRLVEPRRQVQVRALGLNAGGGLVQTGAEPLDQRLLAGQSLVDIETLSA